MSHSTAFHDSPHISKVNIYKSVFAYKIGNSLYALSENVIGHRERLEHRCVLFAGIDESVVRDDDQRVDKIAEILDALCGSVPALLSFECERFGDDGDCQSSAVHRRLCNDRSSTRSGTSSHACSDEYHVRILDMCNDLVYALLGSFLSDLRIGACASAARNLLAELDLSLSLAFRKSLSVCIYTDERYTLKSGIYHPVDSIASAAADTDDFDDRGVLLHRHKVGNKFHKIVLLKLNT